MLVEHNRIVADTAPVRVFLSYNAKDRSFVEALASKLQSAGVALWFDQWSLQPGDRWQSAIDAAIRDAATILLVVGPSGPSPWQQFETMAALESAAQDGRRLIPVLLPGVSDKAVAELPTFLRMFSWSDLRDEWTDGAAWQQLVGALNVSSPQRAAASQAMPPHPLDGVPVAAYLQALSVSAAESDTIEQWVKSEVARLVAAAPAPNSAGMSDLLAFVHSADRERIRDLLRLLLTCFVPARLLRQCFYLSRSKISQSYRAYRNRLPATAGDTVSEEFLLLHEFFRSRGRLVFWPGEALLEHPAPADEDTLLFFSGAFRLERDEEVMRHAHLTPGQELSEHDAATAVTALFLHPDPAVYPLVTIRGTVAGADVSAVLSRRNFGVNSMSYLQFGEWLKGRSLPMHGFGTARQSSAAALTLQPMVCDFMPDR